MTTEEKRKVLYEFCAEQDKCDHCPVGEAHLQPCCDFASKGAPIDELYSKAFPTTSIKDSGERREFSTGAVRDIQEGKGRCDLMPLDVVAFVLGNLTDPDYVVIGIATFMGTGQTEHLYYALESFRNLWGIPTETMILEVAKHFEDGAKKYGEYNWQKGIPVKCYVDSAVRHYLKWLRGDEDEPHDRAFCWNIMCAIWTCKHKPELNDYAKGDEE